MSECSSLSSKSSCSSSGSSFGNVNPKHHHHNLSITNSSYHCRTVKSSSPRHTRRSRPGIQRSDHSSASVMQLDIDDSCHSFCSVSSLSSNKPISKLTRKESLRQPSSYGRCFDLDNSKNRSNNRPVTALSIGKDLSKMTLSHKPIRIASSSENKYIPISCRTGLSPDEIENTWFTSNDYEVQRIANGNIIYLMEQEIQKNLEIDGIVTLSTLASVVQRVEGARGLEFRTKAGAALCDQNRKESIQTVLREQKNRNNDDDYDSILQQTIEQRIANAYSMAVLSATQNAIERAMNDAAEAGIVRQGDDYPCTNQILSTTSRRNLLSTVSEGARHYIPLPLQDNTSCIEYNESIHSLSPSRKLRYYRDRDHLNCPKPLQRQSSMCVPYQPLQSREKLQMSSHSPRKVLTDPTMLYGSLTVSSHHSKLHLGQNNRKQGGTSTGTSTARLSDI